MLCCSPKLRQSKTQNTLTLQERPLAGSAVLPDICGRELQLHVRRLPAPAKGRLQHLGDNRAELIGQIRRVLKNNGDFFASVLSVDDESYPRSRWAEVEPGTFDDGSGKLFHFFTREEIIEEIDVLTVLDMDMLENVHPEAGRKSSLHIIAGKNGK